LRRVELEVVTLQEDRPAPTGPDRGSQDDGRVLRGSLVGVGHLALGDLEDHGARVAGERLAECLPSRQVCGGTDIDGGHGEARRLEFATAPGHVQLMDGGRWAAQRLDASQINQRAASRSPASSLKTASKTSSSMT